MTAARTPRGGLEGHACLVTGGGSGIGLECAARLASDGSHVTICGRTEGKLKDAVGMIEARAAKGVTVQYAVADVTDEEQVIAAVATACQPGGKLDGVIASAGGSAYMGPITKAPLELWRRVMSLNVDGTFLTLKHSAAVMVRAGGGSFVGISSIAGAVTHRFFGPYGVAKSGIEALCRLAADELGASGVRVNAIRPGLVATELVEGIVDAKPVYDDYLDQMPLRRIGQPEDIAALCRFLIGPESSWVTGQVIGADGGHALRRGPDFTAVMEPVYGADALRGVVEDD